MDLRRTLPYLAPALAGILTAALLVALGGSRLLAPVGSFPAPLWLSAFVALVAVLSLYRPPLAGAPTAGPGLGAAALPPILVLGGAVPAAWALAAGMVLREVAVRLLARWTGSASPPEGPLVPALSGAAVGGMSTLAAAGAWTVAAGSPNSRVVPLEAWPLLAATVAFLVSVALLRLLLTLLSEPGRWRQRTLALLPLLALGLAPELFGWLTGLVLARVTRETSGALVVMALVPLALLAAEAARLRLRAEEARRRLSGFDRVGRAGQRLVAHGPEMASVVERLDRECRNVLPVGWMRFELTTSEAERQVWGAGPRGELEEGEPEPPPHPPARPGFHRRASWEVIERELTAEEVPVAQLTLWCDPRDLEEDDLRLFDNLLPQMAASVHRSLLDREAREDPLTGVAVRREMERRLEQLWRRAVEGGEAVAVILCDLDHFKRINDTWGHPVGDRALQAAARALESGLRRKPRPEDLLARYGGEEFAVVLDGADARVALRVAERLRRAVDAVDFRQGRSRIPLTMSAGVAAFPFLHVKTAGELVLLADGALYEAKRRGRNRVLLDLGRGRYRDPEGEIWKAEDAPEGPIEAPRIFS